MQIAIVLYPGFTALDFIGPYEVLHYLDDAEVRFVWHEAGPISADSGLLLIGATHSFDETPSPEIIIVPGGMTSFEHARDPKLLQWIRKAHETSKWTTSVCSGSVIMAAAGILHGKQATSHWSVLSALKPFGVTPVGDQRMVQRGKIVTAAGVSAGLDMALWLVGQIDGERTARAIQLAIEYDPQPPYDSGHLSKASAGTKAAALTILAQEFVRTGQLTTPIKLLWDRALTKVCSRKQKAAVHPR